MAYATLSSLEYTINQILNDDRFSISPHEKYQLIYLDKCGISLQAFLEEFPDRGKILEARIRDVAAEAEDIIDLFHHEHIQFDYMYTEWNEILRRLMFQIQLQKVSDEMDSIAAQVFEIQNSIIIKDVELDDSPEASSSSQVADTIDNHMVGFDGDLKQIKEKLCRGAAQLQILPIIGMGGIGKTTLARNAYNDQTVVEDFQIRVWVTISQDYSKRRILFDLLDSMKEFDPDWRKESKEENSKKCNESPAKISEKNNKSWVEIHELNKMEIQSKVYKILIPRKFLIVMDDMWSTKVWDDVKHLFPNGNKGSRIMLTTRLGEVARYANSSTLQHEMRLMDVGQSWNLLREKVFKHQVVPTELQSVGREIANSCQGLPLAIVVIAGLLSTTSKTQTSWEEVSRNIRSSLATADGRIEKILSLSYNHLPQHLRPCFLYMGGFPEDEVIKATHLIRLWMAENFVKPLVSIELEDIALGYLEDLVDRNLIIINERKSNGKIKSCSLHDTIREMCIKLFHEEKLLLQVKDSQGLESMQDQRRLSIYHSDLDSFSNRDSSTIRSIIYFHHTVNSFGNSRLLRVLDLLRAQNQPPSLCDQFFELFHLRYLAFMYSYQIPRTISNLQSLQTLIINDVTFSCLPYEIWNMPQLRHLIFFSKLRLPDTNATTSALENLQTLGRVENLPCSVDNLKLIPNLKKLWLTYSQEVGDKFLQNLVHLRRLEKLHLEAEMYLTTCDKLKLDVPSSLKKLTLIGWGGYLDIAGPFPTLEVLKLKSFNFKGHVWRITDEDFPQLQFLLIAYSNLRQWETESTPLPKLKSLLIHSCGYLSEIPECIGEITTLELIELGYCTDSLKESAKGIEVEAKENGNYVLQVRFIQRFISGNKQFRSLDGYMRATSLSQVTEIKEKLCGMAPQLQVLPIFGMGGIGKTTLARNVYDNKLIKHHFQIRAWITISQYHSERRILLDLLYSMKEFDPDRNKEPKLENSDHCSSSEMALKIHRFLRGRRFLIVMDGICSTNLLDDIKHFFPDDNNGSRIMLTTRLKEVARYPNSSILPHEMSLMDADQSWYLLWRKVFINRARIPQELESIGRQIARCCRGLPLVLVLIAGVLSSVSETLTSWEEIARTIRLSLATQDRLIEKIFSLSYTHLPQNLKSCLLYMVGFPGDYKIEITSLIRLWIAEGFVKPVAPNEFEDTAKEYLEDLVDRNLIVVTKTKRNGNIKYCGLHDTVREMCIKLSLEEKFLLHVKDSQGLESMKDQQRISIYHSDLNSFSNIYCPTIRSIIYLEDELRSFGNFKLLRVLDLLRARKHPGSLSDQLFELFHLRYLAFWYSHTIPRAISNLQSLQTLIIKEISDSCLPYEIWNMQQLRHLMISNCCLADTTAATSALENLRTLREVKNLVCSVTTLNLIPNLTELWLTYSDGSGELLLHNLVHLRRLEKLHLELGSGWRDSGKPNLVVPSSLKYLTLVGWGIEEPYLDIVGPFPNLKVLKLRRFNFMLQKWRATAKDFPRLKFLLVEESDLRELETTERRHFPRLNTLKLRSCPCLREIPECIGDFPALDLIELKFCTGSAAKSAKGIQEKAQKYGNVILQVRIIDCEPIEEFLPSDGDESDDNEAW